MHLNQQIGVDLEKLNLKSAKDFVIRQTFHQIKNVKDSYLPFKMAIYPSVRLYCPAASRVVFAPGPSYFNSRMSNKTGRDGV